jgi:hypothetical protein
VGLALLYSRAAVGDGRSFGDRPDAHAAFREHLLASLAAPG